MNAAKFIIILCVCIVLVVAGFFFFVVEGHRSEPVRTVEPTQVVNEKTRPIERPVDQDVQSEVIDGYDELEVDDTDEISIEVEEAEEVKEAGTIESIEVEEKITVIRPASGTQVQPGEVIEFEFFNKNLTELLLITSEFAEDGRPTGDVGHFVVNYTVPKDAIGNITLAALGKFEGEEFAMSEELTLVVSLASAGAIQSISSLQREEALFVGGTRPMYIRAEYADGEKREITSTHLGTKYVFESTGTNESGIASVDSEGLITGNGVGEDLILVTHPDYHGEAHRILVLVFEPQ